ncbi:MAG: hypothetical protein O2955_15555 [Planctomycetota bacterium]|nr:hypothetical protein [Planctomycetota bacterium]
MRIPAILASIVMALAFGWSQQTVEGQSASRKSRPTASGELKTGKAYQAALSDSLSATWQASEIGESSHLHVILTELSKRFHVAIMLDRRVNPQQNLTLQVRNTKLRDVLEQIAATLSSEEHPLGVSFLSNVVYIAPKPAADRMRTLIELRTRELDPLRSGVERKTTGWSLTGRYSRDWNDLQSPRDLIQEWTQRHRIEIENPDLIEHDLWRKGDLPQCTITEALSLVLNQFDLTFEWKVKGQRLSIELVPVPGKIIVESTFSLKSLKSDNESLDEIKRLLDDAGLSDPLTIAKVDSGEVTVEGRIEAVEELMTMLTNIKPGSKGRKNKSPKGSISRKVFTLTVRDAPLSAILEKLIADGIAIEWDDDAFLDAGIDLTQPVTLSVEQVSTEDLLKALFKSQPVDVSVKKETVQLTVRSE